MTNGRTPLYLTILVLLGLAAIVLWRQPYSADWPGSDYTRPARRYVQAALRQDSTALADLSASGAAVAWGLAAARTPHRPLEAWARRAQTWVGRRHADTVEVFVFNASAEVCPDTPIRLRFVGAGATAKVVQANSACFDER